jgi:hypothetical protein
MKWVQAVTTDYRQYPVYTCEYLARIKFKKTKVPLPRGHSGAPIVTWVCTILTLLVLTVLGLMTWQRADRRVDQRVWRELIEKAGPPQAKFSEAMLEGLPESAQRYFRYTIEEGVPLKLAVEIDIRGKIGLGDLDQPKFNPMSARQILAPPHGLVWALKARSINGSDGATPNTSWTRFWLFKLIPVVRVGGGSDHHRSAFGRVVAEGAFWVPASLLPSEFVRWESVNQTTARAIVRYAGFEQMVEITVAESGQPTRIVIPRWSNENADKVFREQPFGGELSKFRRFDGYLLPTRVTGGNHIGTEDYFPFYNADVIDIHFPSGEEEE